MSLGTMSVLWAVRSILSLESSFSRLTHSSALSTICRLSVGSLTLLFLGYLSAQRLRLLPALCLPFSTLDKSLPLERLWDISPVLFLESECSLFKHPIFNTYIKHPLVSWVILTVDRVEFYFWISFPCTVHRFCVSPMCTWYPYPETEALLGYLTLWVFLSSRMSGQLRRCTPECPKEVSRQDCYWATSSGYKIKEQEHQKDNCSVPRPHEHNHRSSVTHDNSPG